MTELDFSLLLTDIADDYLLDVEAFLAKKRGKKPISGGKKAFFALIAAVICLLGGLVTAMAVNEEFRETVASWVGIAPAQIEPDESAVQEEAPAFEIPAAPYLTDEFIEQQIIRKAEQALPDDSFQFDEAGDLSSEQLMMLYLSLTPRDELETHRSKLDGYYYFPAEDIRETLDRYFESHTFDITQCANYDAASGAARFTVPAGDDTGFGQYLEPRIEEKSADGNTATFTIGFYWTLYHDGVSSSECYRRKVYTVEFYEGGWFYRAAKTLFFLPPAEMEEVALPDFDPAEPVAAEELVLSNGVHLGMRYGEVIETLGGVVAPAQPEGKYPYFLHEGIFYSFMADDAGEYRLQDISIQGAQSDVSTMRGIHLGMDIADVLALIPARDTQLKKWAVQTLYEDGEKIARLDFVADSFYSLNIETGESVLSITFSRVGTQVKYINIDAYTEEG